MIQDDWRRSVGCEFKSRPRLYAKQLFLIGLRLFLGIFITIIASLTSKYGKVEYGFGGFIGPIPFGFGSSQRTVYIIIGMSLVILILFFVLSRK